MTGRQHPQAATGMGARPSTWEADLEAELARAERRAFAYWQHDCVSAACRLAGAAMGRDLLGFVVVGWDERRAKILLDTFGGVAGFLAIVARMAWLCRALPARAHRGALVTVRPDDGVLRAGCLLGANVAVVGPEGLRRIPARYVESAWDDA